MRYKDVEYEDVEYEDVEYEDVEYEDVEYEDVNVLAGGRNAKPPPVSTGYPEGVAEECI